MNPDLQQRISSPTLDWDAKFMDTAGKCASHPNNAPASQTRENFGHSCTLLSVPRGTEPEIWKILMGPLQWLCVRYGIITVQLQRRHSQARPVKACNHRGS